MIWTHNNKTELEKLWKLGKPDDELARLFGTTEMAVARMRSKLGYVSHKRRFAHNSKPGPQKTNFYVLNYIKDGVQHYLNVEENGEPINNRCKNIVKGLQVKEAIILKPITKLVVEQISEISL